MNLIHTIIEKFSGFFSTLFGWIDSATWGFALIPFLVVLGIFFTAISGFVQFRYFKRMFAVLGKEGACADPDSISARAALFVSVGGRVGGGNIAGVAVAISVGGPGAVFWMWAIALMGMCTSLVESTLAQLFKRRDANGSLRGGPAQSIIYGLGNDYRWLATLYSVCLIASFAIGFNAFQGNTVAGAFNDSIGIPRYITGILLTGLTGFIVFGGIKRIARTADFVIPVMAIGYVGMTLLIIVLNITDVPRVLGDIFANAFGFREAVAGGVGSAVAQGLRRGLFSNEAGLGSAPNVAASARVRHPVSQGITQSLSVFIDTIIICSCTAFMILLGDVYQPGASIDGVALTQQSLVHHVGDWAKYFLTVAILLFSFSSIIYNYYLGETALTYLTEKAKPHLVLKIAVMGIVFLGCVAPGATSIFAFSDPLMGIMALINLLALAMLFPIAVRLINDFNEQLKAGIAMPKLNSEKFSDLNIEHEVWKNTDKRKK